MRRILGVGLAGLLGGCAVALGINLLALRRDSQADTYSASRLLESQHHLEAKMAWTRQERVAVDLLWQEAGKTLKETEALKRAGIRIREVVKVQTQTKTVTLPPDLSKLDVSAEVTDAKVVDSDGTAVVKVAVSVNLADPESGWHDTVALEAEKDGVKWIVPTPDEEAVKKTAQKTDGKYHLGRAWVCGPGVAADMQVWPKVDAGVGLVFACIHGSGFVKTRETQ